VSDDPKGGQFSRSFSTGEYVFHEGDAGSEMFIIQEGQVEILKDIGGQEIRVALLDEGDFFGEMSILEDLPRMASARAVGPCVLLSIDSSTFDQMARHNPEIPVRMLRKLSRRLRDANVVNIEAAPSSMTIVPTGSVPGIEAARREALAAPVLPPSEPAPRPPAAPVPIAVAVEPPAVRRAYLLHDASGDELPLSEDAETHLGRPDAATGFVPHIDLRPIDTQRSTSRRHARILRRDGGYFLREEIGVANGTFVNGKRVPTGVDVALSDGDEIRFGLVKTSFHLR
jgi:hypothetical protein